MKMYYYLLLILIFFAGCSGENVAYIEYYSTLVVKFTNPEYKNYIYTEKYGDNGYHFRCGHRTVCDDFIAGKCPYIEIGDDYYLVDWKWPWQTYSSDVLLKLPWSNMTGLDQKFGKDTIETIPGPYIEEQYCIYFYDIDAYLHVLKHYEADVDYSFMAYNYGWMHSVKGNSIKGDISEYERNVTRCDSIQAEYVQKLRWIVASGNFPFKGRFGGL